MNKYLKLAPLFLFLFSIGCATTKPSLPLLHATHDYDIHQIERLLKNGAEIDAFSGKNGETALMAAARGGDIDIVKLLVSV